MENAFPRVVRRAALALGMHAVLTLTAARIPPRFGEPLTLRWIRSAADHPVRTPLALTLLLVGLARSPGARSDRGGTAKRDETEERPVG